MAEWQGRESQWRCWPLTHGTFRPLWGNPGVEAFRQGGSPALFLDLVYIGDSVPEHLIARRRLLKYIGILTATPAGRNFLAAWLPSASASAHPVDGKPMPEMHMAPPPDDRAIPNAPQFFTRKEFETVEILTDMIIPTDDKPGAKEAQVANYIDLVVFAAAENQPELQKEWTEGLALLDRLSKRQYIRPFSEIAATEREWLLTEMSLPEHDPKAVHPGFAFYRLVKGMTVEGFYTSRVGLIDVLEFQGLAFLAEFPGCTHPEHQS